MTLGPDAEAFLDALLAHELTLRPRVRCVVTGWARAGSSPRRRLVVRRSTHGEGALPAPRSRLRRN